MPTTGWWAAAQPSRRRRGLAQLPLAAGVAWSPVKRDDLGRGGEV